MRNRIIPALFVLLTMLSTACEKEEDNAEQAQIDAELSKNNYIKGFVNGEEIDVNGKLPLGDVFFNSYISSERTLRMQRVDTANNKLGFDIAIERVDLSAISASQTFTYSSDQTQPSLRFDFYDSTAVPYGLNIADPSSFELTITSTNQDLMIGTFEGRLYNQNLEEAEVLGGIFRVKVKRYP